MLAAKGNTDKEIAVLLGLSAHTVAFHFRSIFRMQTIMNLLCTSRGLNPSDYQLSWYSIP
jgi:DNA-binding NarL/FixJ family response regulator